MITIDVSIIIVNYHSAGMVIDCINSIHEKTENLTYEIIVVDNASGDGSLDILRQAFGSEIKLLASPENLGFGKANNLGAAEANGKYLFLLNPDTILINNAVKTLFDYLENHPDVGVAGGNLYTPDMSPAPSFCRAFDDLDTEKKRASWQYLIGNKVHDKLTARNSKVYPISEFNHSDSPEKVAYIFGADMMTPKALFDQVGGFDPDFFMYAEEEELTWRITQQGFGVMCIPQAKIIHLEGATVKNQDEFSPRQFKMRMNGTLTYYIKRFGDRGATEFYKLRSLRYERLMKIAKLQHKLTSNFTPAVQKNCLDEVYRQFSDEMLSRGDT